MDVDEAALKQVAQIGNGQFFRATDSKSLEQIFGAIDQLEKSTVETSQYQQYRDLFAWVLGPGLALLALHALLGQTVFRRIP
jgi:Ca-activated chloride channel family protein